MSIFELEESDPTAIAIKRMRRKLRNLVIVTGVVAAHFIFIGVPAIQWNYRHMGSDGIPTAMEKYDADYLSPFGYHQAIEAGTYSNGCPILICIPLKECIDLSAYKNALTSFLLPKGFFHD